MSDQVTARQDPSWLVAFKPPDFYKTPPSMAPVSYPLTANLGKSVATVPTILINGLPTLVSDQTMCPMSIGDQPGVDLGGNPMVREGDEYWKNGKTKEWSIRSGP